MNNRHRGAWLTLGTLEWIVVGGGAQFTSDVSGATSIRRERRAVEGWRKELDNIITWLLPPGSFLHESGSSPSAFICAGCRCAGRQRMRARPRSGLRWLYADSHATTTRLDATTGSDEVSRRPLCAPCH